MKSKLNDGWNDWIMVFSYELITMDNYWWWQWGDITVHSIMESEG